MYIPTDDEIVALDSLPPCETGAPSPIVLADEFRTFVAYYARAIASTQATWDAVPISDPMEEPVVLLEFSLCYAHLFGPPNDEAFSGHPLFEKGLRPYTMAEVRHSSWIASLERMNSVHPHHRPERFQSRRHFILPFHDSTFECIADGVQAHFHRGSVQSAVSVAAQMLRERG